MTEAARDILSVLERQCAITPTGRAVIEGYCRRWGLSPFHALLETEVLDETRLADVLAAGLGIDRLLQVRLLAPAPDALKIIGFKRARQWEVMAFQGDGAGSRRLDVCFADPTHQDRIDLLRRELNCEFTLSVAERSDIVSAIDELIPLADQLPALFGACRS